ncbi:MAG TPA: hypothetical protein VH143_26500 [Kofleriaceae bacterium]|nr:hypothetical protein [Kofleriaceae bacterium]
MAGMANDALPKISDTGLGRTCGGATSCLAIAVPPAPSATASLNEQLAGWQARSDAHTKVAECYKAQSASAK